MIDLMARTLTARPARHARTRPDHVAIIREDRETTTGKVLRRELRDPIREPDKMRLS
jgi:hypothetical protein